MKHNFKIIHFEQLSSTNDHAKEKAAQYGDKTVIWCDHQTHGRGRFERVWESKNDLTFSILFQKDGVHQMIAPLAVVLALSSFNIPCQIKWPNDILYQGKKLCGILVEKIFQGDNCSVIVGIGVNLSEPSLTLQQKATYLPFSPAKLLSCILEQYEKLLSESETSIWQNYRKYNYLQGRKILRNAVLWDVVDISKEGWLMVSHDHEIKMWKSEEITLEHIYEENV